MSETTISRSISLVLLGIIAGLIFLIREEKQTQRLTLSVMTATETELRSVTEESRDLTTVVAAQEQARDVLKRKAEDVLKDFEAKDARRQAAGITRRMEVEQRLFLEDFQLLRLLKLDPESLKEFVRILDQRSRLADDMRDLVRNQGVESAVAAEALRQIEQKTDAELLRLLGSQRMEALQEYEDHPPANVVINELDRRLDGSGGLSDASAKALSELLYRQDFVDGNPFAALSDDTMRSAHDILDANQYAQLERLRLQGRTTAQMVAKLQTLPKPEPALGARKP